METHEQKKRRLFGKQFLNEYNSILDSLQLQHETSRVLLSIVETDEILKQAANLNLKHSLKTLFDNKKEKLKWIIESYIKDANEPFFLIISLSHDCGALKIDSLNDFNLDFGFDDVPSGMITLISHLCKESILLDFYKENNELLMEIELYQD